MKDTDIVVCRRLAAAARAAGVKYVISSPGTRNAPLTLAFKCCDGMEVLPVVDERSAAFIALGIAAQSGKPVVIECTSGTAPLNYASALAEAFYRHLPIIAVTADRPSELINQNVSQTIVQLGIYNNFICAEYDISSETDARNVIADAFKDLHGPIHINVHISEPLNGLCEHTEEEFNIHLSERKSEFDREQALELSEAIKGLKTWIVIGHRQGSRNSELNLQDLASNPDLVVFHETPAGIKNGDSYYISNIDATILAAGIIPDELLPDVIITAGGALVSVMVNKIIAKGIKHWSINKEGKHLSTFGRDAERVFTGDYQTILESIPRHKSNLPASAFKSFWLEKSLKAHREFDTIVKDAPWCELVAVDIIMKKSTGRHIELGNGMTVRYFQLISKSQSITIDSNRGVSGIDGSLSTAIGAACVSNRPVTVVLGDMGFQYDMGALATNFIPDNFRIIVMNNNGGNIFRYIKNTRELPIMESHLASPVKVPVKQLAAAFGFNYFRAENAKSLADALDNDLPRTIIEVVTDPLIDNKILTNYYKSCSYEN